MGLMASFERGMERFLVPVAIKLNSQKHVAAVRDGFVFTFPIIMASSLIILINFAILSPDGFIAGLLHLNSIFPNLEKAQAIFTPVMNGSVNIMSIMIAFLVARNMAISYEQDYSTGCLCRALDYARTFNCFPRNRGELAGFTGWFFMFRCGDNDLFTFCYCRQQSQ